MHDNRWEGENEEEKGRKEEQEKEKDEKDKGKENYIEDGTLKAPLSDKVRGLMTLKRYWVIWYQEFFLNEGWF